MDTNFNIIFGKFIENSKKQQFEASYAFYKKKSKYGKQIAFMIDSEPFCPRRSMILNNHEVIATRWLRGEEKVEAFATHGNRKYVIYYYEKISDLQKVDKEYGIDTPLKFVDECKKRGYN